MTEVKRIRRAAVIKAAILVAVGGTTAVLMLTNPDQQTP